MVAAEPTAAGDSNSAGAAVRRIHGAALAVHDGAADVARLWALLCAMPYESPAMAA